MSIKSLIKKYDKSYVLEDLELISLDIKEKSENDYSKKKIKKILCKYSDIDNGKIIFKKNKNNDMNFEKLSEEYYKDKNFSKKDNNIIKSNKLGGIRLNFLNVKNSKKEDSDYEYKSDEESENDHEEYYNYPIEEKKSLNRNDDISFGPYGSQWCNDIQVDDKLNKDEKRRRKVFDFLNSIKYPEQRSEEWFKNREEKITASDGGCIVGVNKYEPVWKFIKKKVLGLPFQSNIFCYHGKKLEEIATMVYEFRMNVKVKEFGMVPHPKINHLGASPDGIVSPYKLDQKHLTKYVGRMLEIKCPLSRKIKKVGEVKGEICPIYYWVQVQLQLECCDLDECDFWQCEILEYDDREDFVLDTDIEYPYLSKTNKMEKGALIQLLPLKKPSEDLSYLDLVYSYAQFIYPPKIEMSPYDVDVWLSTTLSKLKDTHPDYYFDKIIYWQMFVTHNVTIKRDVKWFEENKSTYEEIWNYVTILRNNLDKANIIFEYIDNLKRKDTDSIMNLIKKICDIPDENDKISSNKYNIFIENLIKDNEINDL